MPDFVQNWREHLRLLPPVVVQGISLPQNAPPVGGTRARHGNELLVQVQVGGVRRTHVLYAGFLCFSKYFVMLYTVLIKILQSFSFIKFIRYQMLLITSLTILIRV